MMNTLPLPACWSKIQSTCFEEILFVEKKKLIKVCYNWNQKQKELLWPITRDADKSVNQSETELHTTRRGNSRLVLILLLIGLESGTRFAGQSQSEAMQNQSKRDLLSTLNWKPPRYQDRQALWSLLILVLCRARLTKLS